MQFPQWDKADLNSSQKGHYLQVLGKPRAREGHILPRRIPKQQNTFVSHAKASGSPGRTQEQCKPHTLWSKAWCFPPTINSLLRATGEGSSASLRAKGTLWWQLPFRQDMGQVKLPPQSHSKVQRQGPGAVHANDQQLPGLTAQPTALSGNLGLNVRH